MLILLLVIEKVSIKNMTPSKPDFIFLAPGQMKTQKEAIALKLKIDQLRELQEETRRKAREAEMIREGIPLNRDEERGYKDRRFMRDDRGGGGRGRDDRGGRDDRRGIFDFGRNKIIKAF